MHREEHVQRASGRETRVSDGVGELPVFPEGEGIVSG